MSVVGTRRKQLPTKQYVSDLLFRNNNFSLQLERNHHMQQDFFLLTVLGCQAWLIGFQTSPKPISISPAAFSLFRS